MNQGTLFKKVKMTLKEVDRAIELFVQHIIEQIEEEVKREKKD
jgi:hypothetical protein